MNKACPLKNNSFNASIKENGQYKTYYNFCRNGEVSSSPASVSNEFDEDHYISPGVSYLYELNKEYEQIGDRTWYSAYLKREGYTHILYKDPEYSLLPEYDKNIYFENYATGRIPVAVVMPSVLEFNDNTESDEDDFSKAIGKMSNEQYSGIKFTGKQVGSSNIIYYPDEVKEINIEEDKQNFRDFVVNEWLEEQNDTTQWSLSELQKEPVDIQDEDFLRGYKGFEQRIGIEFANKISESLGIEYEVISEEEARNNYPSYNGETSFFTEGKVIFIDGKIDADSVFHEFAHPFIRSMRQDNNELFEQIYNDFIKTDAGRIIDNSVRTSYNYPNEDLYKEETMVYALQQAAEKAELFDIKNILYGIKRTLRNKYGKDIAISKLNENTTLAELAKILQSGNKILFESSVNTYNNLLMFFRKELIPDLESAFIEGENGFSKKSANLVNIVDDFYKTAKFALMKANQDSYKDIIPEYLKEKFQEIVRYINLYRSDYIGLQEIDPVELMNNQAKALANSLAVFDELIDRVYERIRVAKNLGSDAKLSSASHYSRLTDNWKKMLESMDESAVAEGLSRSNPLRKYIADNLGKIKDIKTIINDNYAECVSDTLEETLTPMIDNLEQQHKERIEYLEKNGAPEWRINQEYTEFYGMTKEQYDNYKNLKSLKENGSSLTTQQQLEFNKLSLMSSKGIHLDKDIIKGLLKGDLGDIGYLSGMLGSYLTNVDPIVGGFSLYLKNGINEALSRIHEKMVTFCYDIKPDLERIGYNPNNVERLRDTLCFKDKIAKYNPETDEIEEKEVWSYLHEFKNWRYDRAIKEKALKDKLMAYRQNPSDENRKAYLDEKWEFDRWVSTYFVQDFTDEYYSRFDVFNKFPNDTIGKEAYYRLQELFERMNMEADGDYTYIGRMNSYNNTMEMLWREYAQMSSLKHIDGSNKTGKELEIAMRIKEYREKNRMFYDEEINKKKLQSYYLGFMNEIEEEFFTSKGVKSGTPEAESLKSDPDYISYMEDAKNRFMRTYTKTKVSDDFYAYRQDILDRIEAIYDKMPENPEVQRAKIDISNLWKQIIDITSGYRDNMNEIIAEEIEPIARLKIRDIEDKIESMKKSSRLTSNGLSQKQMEEYYTLSEKRRNGLLVNGSEEESKLNKYETRINHGTGLCIEDIDTLKLLYNELAGLSNRILTEHYVDQFNNVLSTISNVDILNELYRRFGTSSDLSAGDIEMILEDEEFVNELMSQSEEFQKFITDEHLFLTRYDIDEEKEIAYYKPIYCWTQVLPSDSRFMETYDMELLDEEGTVTDVITLGFRNSNGDFIRTVPSREFMNRHVKEKYRTQKNIGINRDNQGKWLPKNKEQMDKTGLPDEEKYKYINTEYFNLKNSNPVAFELLEKLKRYHIAFQQGLGFNERLYYDVPRAEKNNLEKTKETTKLLSEPKSLLVRWAKRAKDWILGAAQDSGDVLNYNASKNLVRADIFADDLTEVTIDGLQDIDIENQSANIITNELRFMASAEKHKQLVSMSPLADALLRVLEEEKNKVKDNQKIDKNSFLMGLIKRVNKYRDGKESNREHFLKILIEREFKGVKNDDMSNNALLNNAINFLEKKASFAFFAFNPLSSIKNAIGMKYNFIIEGSSGKFVNTKDIARGNIWAAKTVAEHTAYIHNRGPKPLSVQMAEIFDFNQDKFYNELGKNMSRTITSDVVDGNIFYNFRRITELQGIYELGAARLNHIKLDRYDSEGNKNVITYLDAWEIDPISHRVKLKDGIDVRYSQDPTYVKISEVESYESLAKKLYIPESDIDKSIKAAFKHKASSASDMLTNLKNFYNEDLAKYEEDCDNIRVKYANDETLMNIQLLKRKEKFDRLVSDKYTIKIENTKFDSIKNSIHGIENHAGGAYAQFDQPAAQRNFLFRAIYYLRKFAPSMLDNRFGYSNIGGIINQDADGNIHFDFGKAHARRSYILGDTHGGYYTSSAKFIFQNLTHLSNMYWTATPEEKQAISKTIADILLWLSMHFIVRFVFGFDDDDDDKYKKLRKLSGALPTLFTDPEESKNFKPIGWFQLQMLNLMLQVQTENSQFQILDVGKSLKNWTSLIDLNPYFFGPTIESYQKVWGSLFNSFVDDEKINYSRRVGPYIWQQKGDWKAWNYFLKMFGITGSTVDPLLGIQNQVSFAQKATSR